MSLFDKLRSALTGASPGRKADRNIYPIRVRCRRCGEILTTEVNLLSELSVDFDRNVYHVRKMVMGSGENRCFAQVEVSLTFDMNRRLITREVVGGSFVDEEN